jgi:hypothetical protein
MAPIGERGSGPLTAEIIEHHVARLTHLRARRTVKHPGRNLKPTLYSRSAQVAAKNNAVRLADRFVNADPKTKPRMPSVTRLLETRFRGRS